VLYYCCFTRARGGRKDDEFFQLIREISSSGKGRHFILQTPNANGIETGVWRQLQMGNLFLQKMQIF